jgi:hypothetical protein
LFFERVSKVLDKIKYPIKNFGARSVAQVGGHLPRIHKAVSSNPILPLSPKKRRWALVAHACNAMYLGGRDPYDCKTLISKITTAKCTEGVTQMVEHLLCKHEVLNSNPSPTEKKKKTIQETIFMASE